MIVQQNPYIMNNHIAESARINFLVNQLGKQTALPDSTRNYCNFNYPLVAGILQYREKAIPHVLGLLSISQDEKEIAEGLYVLDRMIDAGVKGIEKTYPVLARFNDTPSPTIQVLLAGIYRKTQPPEAFGPLCKMLIRDSLVLNSPHFDPTEEVGGAILEYLRNKSAISQYQSPFSNSRN